MQCPQCQRDRRAGAKFCDECGRRSSRSTSGGSRTPSFAEVAKALREAHEQQTATSEILQVISRSRTDIQRVFETIVRNAVRLCDGFFGIAFPVRWARAQHHRPSRVLTAGRRGDRSLLPGSSRPRVHVRTSPLAPRSDPRDRRHRSGSRDGLAFSATGTRARLSRIPGRAHAARRRAHRRDPMSWRVEPRAFTSDRQVRS